jgi:hypothetical protein
MGAMIFGGITKEPIQLNKLTSIGFFTEIKSVTPDSLHYLLHDLFEKNIFWELETKNVNAYQLAVGL